MNKRITFNVTQSRIKAGKRDNCYDCPVALAISARVKDSTRVAVGTNHIELNSSEIVYNNYRVTKFIKDFDRCLPVEPFRFSASIPIEYLK